LSEDKASYFSSAKDNSRIDYFLPIILLVLAGTFILLTENHNAAFTPGGLYSGVSVHGMTLSKNLMHNDQHLFMYTSRELHNGKIAYDAYNRFPVLPFILTGILSYPFESNPVLQIYVARQSMNIFFLLSIIVVFKIVDNLVKNKYLSVSVTLISFSSFYMLSYNDMVFNDIPALFGFVLALYSIVLVQNKKLSKPKIFFFSIFPICLGWQPYAVFITWFLIEALEMFAEKKTNVSNKIRNIIHNPSFIISGLALIWGITLLGLQLLNEWRIVGGSFMNIPSLNSALWRSGLIPAAGHTQYQQVFDWIPFLSGVTHSITLALIPFFPVFQVEPGYTASVFLVVSLLIYVIIKYSKDKNSFNKIIVIMILSGLFWAIPMRRFVALHEFQSIFFVGFTISVYILLLSSFKPNLQKFLAIDIVILFLLTVLLSNYYKTPDLAMNRMIPQFRTICNQLPANSKIYFDGDRQHAIQYSRFAIDFFLIDHVFTQEKDADYVISKNPDYHGVKLTTNPEYNLYKY